MIHRRFVTLLSLFALLLFTGSIAFGQATKVVIEDKDDGTGFAVVDANLTAGQTITVFAIARDDVDTFIENVQVDADGWSLINTTGGVVGGDLNPAGNRKSATFTARKIGSAQINATVTPLTSIPSGVQTVIAGAPDRVAVETQANGGGTVVPTQNLASGSSVTGFAITRDAFDNFVANEAATWSLQSITGGISPSDLTASGDGKSAQFTGALVGTAEIQATTTIGGLTGLSGTITVTPGPAAQLAFVQQPTDGASGTAISPAVTVHIRDAGGNLVTTSTQTVTVALGANPGGGTLSGTLSVAAVGGIATFSNLSIDKIGNGYTLAASAGGLTGATSSTFNIILGGATQLAFVQQPTDEASGTAISPAVTVHIRDAGGNLVTTSTQTVTVALGANPGGGTLSGTLSVAAVGGIATFSNLSIDKVGNGYTLAASAGGLTGATSSTFNIILGGATQLAFVQQPTDEASGTAISPAVTVHIRDAGGNLVTTSTQTVTVALGANPGGGTLSGTLSVAAVGGIATFSNLSIDKVGNGYTLAASAGGLTGATSSTFNIILGGATQLAFVQQPTDEASGTAISPAVTVHIRDAGGNLVTTSTQTVTVALGANPGGGTLSGTLSVAAVGGIATFSNLSIDKVGNGYTLAASAGGLTGATSSTFNIILGGATQLAFVQQPTDEASGTAISPAVTVHIRDAGGNLVTTSTQTVTVALGANPGGGTLSGTLSVAAVGGIATFSNLSIDKVGNGYTLAASAGGLTGATSSTFNIILGGATQLAFVQQPTDGASGTAISPAVTVHIRDAGGNLVTTSTQTVTVALGANPGGGTLSGTLSVAAVGGIATFSNLSIDKVGNGYTLAASAGGLTGATSSTFNIILGGATQLAFVQQPTDEASGTAISPAVTVHIRDAGGNLVTTSTRGP